MNIYMEKAKQNADNGIKNKEGGPFGAIITDKEGKIIALRSLPFDLKQLDREECLKTFKKYSEENGTIY